MSTSGSFWSQIRWRLGGSDAMLAQISDLVQKQIDANADAQEVTEEDILNPIIVSPSKLVVRDNLYKVRERTVDEGLINLIPVDPDLTDMRLWIRNDHGGRYINDHSFMGNRVQLNGTDQSKLIFTTDDDSIEGPGIVNQLIDDQYLRVEDNDKSPNPNVRIKEIAATAEGISIFIRLYVQANDNEAQSGKPGVLFSKIDTEQVDFAYGAYLKSDGSLFWFVRDTGREYTLTTAPAAVVYSLPGQPDFLDTNFEPTDFQTLLSALPPPPDPIPFTDITFTYKFSDKRMQIFKCNIGGSASVIADSTSRPEATGLVGWWRLNEGGDIGNTPDAPSSFARTVYNTVTTGNNGTVTNATWDSNNYLNFGGANHVMDVTNYTAIQNLSAWTISLWYYPKATPAPDAYLIRKGSLTASSWLIYHQSSGAVRFSVWNATPTRFDITSATSAIPSINTWYHIVAKVTIGTPGKIFVNNVKVTGGSNVTGTVDTSTNVVRCGAATAATSPNGLIHDIKIFNRELSDADVATLYNAGHPATYLPSWQANPPSVPPPPGPVTNPFLQVYSAPAAGGVPVSGEQDLVRLHAITAASLTERYNVGQGAQETPPGVPEQGEYSNDPAYDTGTGAVEALSTYDQRATTPVASQYLTLNNATFAGQRFLTGSDVVGKPVLKVVAKMADTNSTTTPATGNITCKIIRNSDGVAQATATGSILAENLANNQGGTSTANWTDNTFSFSGNTYVMVNNDRIQFEYDQGGTNPETLTLFDRLNATLTSGVFSGISAQFIVAQKFLTGNDVIGKIITKIVCKLCDANPTANAATGNIVAKIYTAAHVLKSTSNTIAATGLTDNLNGTSTTGWTTSTFTFSGNTWPMANGDRVQMEYDQGGSPSGSGEALSGYQLQNAAEVNIAACDYNSTPWESVDNTSATIHGKIVTKVVIKLADMVNGGVQATGPVIARIRRGDTSAIVISSNTFEAGSLANYPSKTAVTFTFSSNTWVMDGTRGDFINFEYNYGGGASNATVGVTVCNNAISNMQLQNETGPFSSLDLCMDIYISTPGTYKTVGVAAITTGGETNSNVAQAQWSAPTTFTDDTTTDWAMDVYAGSVANAKAVGIPYFTTAGEANSNAYDAPWSTGTITDRSTFDVGFDVYINAATGQPNHQYTQLRLDATKFVGEIVNSSSAPIYGKKMTKIRARINRVGSPTGSLFCRLKKGSDGTTITFGLNGTPGASLDVATLTTGSTPATLYTFENDDNGQTTGYTTTSGDRIIFELTGGTSNSTNYVQVARTTTASRVANMDLQTSTDGSTWTTVTTDDVIGDMFSGGYTPPPVFPFHTLGYVNSRVVQKVTSTTASVGNIYNQKITQVKPWFKRIGSATGIISVVIRNAADAQVASINTLDASSVDNVSFTQYTFTNLNQTYTMALNDKICVEYSSGDVNNHIQINTNLLDTYPYGNLETFSGSTYTTQTLHDLAGSMSSGGGATDPLARTRVAETVVTTNSTIKLKKISRVTVYLKRTVSPTGNVTIRIRNSADAIMATIGTVAAGTIDPNTPTAYTITSSPISSYALQVGDRVTVEYNLGDDFNYVEVMTSKTTDLFGGVVNTYLEKFDDINWVPNSAIDLVGTMWEGGDSYTPSQEDVLIPDPKYTKDLTILAGGPPWSWVNHELDTVDFAPSQLWISAIVPDFRLYRKVLTTTELNNIATNRLDRGTIPLGQVMKLAYSFITEG